MVNIPKEATNSLSLSSFKAGTFLGRSLINNTNIGLGKEALFPQGKEPTNTLSLSSPQNFFFFFMEPLQLIRYSRYFF